MKAFPKSFEPKKFFPDKLPLDTVGDWVELNQSKFDFNKHGWPAWYPTRSLEEWKAIRTGWEPYVFRKVDSKTAKPTLTFSRRKTVLIKDDFSKPNRDDRVLSAGTWKLAKNITSSRHETPTGEKPKKHGPKVSYKAEINDGSFTFDIKPTDADAVVVLINSAPAMHVFRLRMLVEGGKESVQPPQVSTFPPKEPEAKKAPAIALYSDSIPKLKNGSWNNVQINFVHEKALIQINDQVFAVRHNRINQPKRDFKIELQQGEVALRNVELLFSGKKKSK